MPKVKTYNFNDSISYNDPTSSNFSDGMICASYVALKLLECENYTITYAIPDLDYSITYDRRGQYTDHTDTKDGKVITVATIHSHIAEAFKLALPGCSHSVNNIAGFGQISNSAIYFHTYPVDSRANIEEYLSLGLNQFPGLPEDLWTSADVVE